MDKNHWIVLSVILFFLIIAKVLSSTIQCVIFIGCMITDGSTTTNCQNFTLIPYRVYVQPVSPAASSLVAIIWICIHLKLEQTFPNFVETVRIVVRKLFFYKDSFLVVWLIIYYFIVYFTDSSRPGASDYIVLPIELATTTTLMYILNYRRAPSNLDKDNYPAIGRFYKTILIVWAIHNFYHVLEDTIYVGLNIYTFSSKRFQHHLKAWHSVNLLFLVIAGTYRYLLGNFFLTKFSCCLKKKEYLILRDEDDDMRLPYIPYADIDDVL